LFLFGTYLARLLFCGTVAATRALSQMMVIELIV
jgi:hypothetical protein